MQYAGVAALAGDLLRLKVEWGLDSVAATRLVEGGHSITLTWVGPLLTLENDEGLVVTVRPDEIGVSLDG